MKQGRADLSFSFCLLFIAACIPAATAQAPSPQLKAVLDQMDAASTQFKSAQADVQYDNFVKLVHDHTLETGTIYIERAGNSHTSQQMGAIFFDLGPGGQPNKTPAKIIAYSGGTAQIYSPGVNQVDIFQAGANQARFDTFLTLGFGGSGSDLLRTWTVEDNGPETLTDGGKPVKTEKLDLVSKDPSVRSVFEHVTIWIDPARAVSLKQVFFAPHGDMRTAVYSNLRLNTHVDKRPYAINKNATPIRH